MKLSKIMMIFLTLILFAGAMAGVAWAQNQKPDEKDKKVEKQKDDDDDDDDKNDSPQIQKRLAKQAKISKEEARQKALERVPGIVLESEMEKEKGRLVYEFEIRDKDNKIFEVLVDANTGEIVSVEEENEDDDDEDTGNSQAKRRKDGKWYEFWRKIPGLNKL